MKSYSVKEDRRSRKELPKPHSEVPQRGTCGRCGKTHAKDSCPVVGKTRLKYKKANHFTESYPYNTLCRRKGKH